MAWLRLVIVNYNGGGWIQRCVDALAAQTMGDFEAVVVDNASSDGSRERLVLPDPRFRLMPSAINLGFAAGCNLGSRGAEPPWLAMLNPDAIAAADWLERLREATRRYPGVAMFGSTQIDADDAQRLDGCGDALSVLGIPWRGGFGHPVTARPPDCRVFAPCAAAALYRRQDFEAAGGFDESFFCYIEDVDLAFRLRLAGQDCVQVADAVVAHAGSALSGRNSEFTIYHSFRNRVWMLFQCLPLPLLAFILPLHLAAALALAGLAARRGAPLRVMVRGLADGVRALPARRHRRARVQAGRVVPLGRIAAALSWHIGRMRARLPDPRPLAGLEGGTG